MCMHLYKMKYGICSFLTAVKITLSSDWYFSVEYCIVKPFVFMFVVIFQEMFKVVLQI